MKNYARVGGKSGKPGYRTPSSFRERKAVELQTEKFKETRGLVVKRVDRKAVVMPKNS